MASPVAGKHTAIRQGQQGAPAGSTAAGGRKMRASSPTESPSTSAWHQKNASPSLLVSYGEESREFFTALQSLPAGAAPSAVSDGLLPGEPHRVCGLEEGFFYSVGGKAL